MTPSHPPQSGQPTSGRTQRRHHVVEQMVNQLVSRAFCWICAAMMGVVGRTGSALPRRVSDFSRRRYACGVRPKACPYSTCSCEGTAQPSVDPVGGVISPGPAGSHRPGDRQRPSTAWRARSPITTGGRPWATEQGHLKHPSWGQICSLDESSERAAMPLCRVRCQRRFCLVVDQGRRLATGVGIW
jgi:hypothetical protein